MKGLSRLLTVSVALVLAALVLWPRQIEAQLNRISGTQIVGGTAKPTSVQAGDGSAAAPPFSFLNNPTIGMYNLASGNIGIAIGGVGYLGVLTDLAQLKSTATLGWSSGVVNNATDVALTRPGVGVLKLSQTAATPAEWQVSGGNGGFISSVKALTELTTIAAAATTNTAIQIPANAVVLGVSVRVVTVIPTAATFTVTSATPTKTWNTAAVTVAATSTDPGTLGAPSFQTTASAITITPNLTPGAATGQVRVTIYYYAVTPPTS